MAKFAIVILAAFAFQAASAGVLLNQRFQERTLGDYEYGLQVPSWSLQFHSYPTGKFDALFGQLETVAQDLTVYFQRALPNDRLVVKTLVLQSRELAHYIDAIIERLQAETYNYNGQATIVLEQVIRELRDIQMQFHQIAAYTSDVYAVSQIKSQFHLTVQRTVAQLEKLVRLVQVDFHQSQGELYIIVQNLVTDFLYTFQNIYSHIQYYGAYGQQSPRQLVLQIEEVTKTLIGYLQGVTHFDAQRTHAIREYVQHVEAIINRMQEFERTYSNAEITVVFQQVYSKLQRVLVPFMRFVEAESMENVEVVRMELIKEIQFVAEAFEQFVQYAHAGEYQTFFFEILGDYLYAIQHFRMQLQSGYQSYFGLHQSGFYGKHEIPAFFGKSGYQGLYKYGGLYSKYGYGNGFYGKYQGFAKYGQELKQFEAQIQTIIRDFYQTFETVSFDDATVRQAFIHLIREYAQHLEFIVERLHQYVNYNAQTDAYIFQQVAQTLRQYVVALEQFHTGEYSAVELRTQFYFYVQKIATEFEKLMVVSQQTNGVFYNFVHEILSQYLTATYDLYMHVQNIHEVAQYGYGPYARQYYSAGKYFGGKYGQYYGLQGQQVNETPRELVNQIQYVARDLSASFQNGMLFNQQHAQVLAVQARHFAKIIKNVVDQLEAYEHVDALVQQVIYKLHEVQISFQQLAAYNVFTDIHQFRAEFDSYVHIAVAQIEKLALIAHEETHGDFFYVIKNVLNFFLYGLHDIHHQIQEVAQYGQVAQYGKGYGYGFAKYGKYGREYGFSKNFYGKNGQQYGISKYGFAKYGPQYSQEYGFDKYAHGLTGLSQYGKGYGYGFQNQYGYQHVPSFLASTQYNQDAIRAY